MSGREDPGLDGLSATLMEHIDRVCDRFERAWKAGERPRIEAFLEEEPEPGRSALLRELLVSELECRARLGERPEPREYLERLGAHASLIDAAFEARADPDATPLHPAPGTDWAPSGDLERFRILRPYAEGGLGVIYLAHDGQLNREVALKEIRPGHADRPESRARFLLEAEINGGLEHPGIVPVYSLGRHPDGRPYYAMRFIQGTSLKEAIAEFHRETADSRDPGARTLGLRRLLDRFRNVCEALAYAHSRGVLHRDVKPQNIMVGRYGETLLVDWGLAKATGRPDADLSTGVQPLRPAASEGSDGTIAGSAIGTPAYISPEQAGGLPDGAGPAGDVYGLGATLYHLLAGRPAFEGGTKEVLEKVRRGDFRRPRTARRDVPRALEAVCLKAMALRPEDRYATPRALAEDLERWLADEPVSAYREPWPARARRWVKRHRTFVTAVVAAVLLTAVVLGGCVLMWCLENVEMRWSAVHDRAR